MVRAGIKAGLLLSWRRTAMSLAPNRTLAIARCVEQGYREFSALGVGQFSTRKSSTQRGVKLHTVLR